MRKSILAVFAAAAAAFSCSEQEKVQIPVLVNSTVEVTLDSPATKAFADGTTEEWEKTAHNIVMFVYKSGDDNCAYQKKFSDYEIEKGKAVFAIPEVQPGVNYDFYAIANCDFTAEMTTYDKTNPTGTGVKRTDLIAKIEGTNAGGAVADAYGSLASYNKADVSADADWTAITGSVLRNTGENSGFVMAGMSTKMTSATDDNTPTRVTVSMGRSVAKVAVVAATTNEKTKPGGANFVTKYPGSKLTILEAKIINLAEKTTLIAPTTYSTANLGMAMELEQVPHIVPAVPDPTAATPEEKEQKETPAQYQNLFYIYENSDGTTAPTDGTFADFKPVLVLTALFDFDGVDNGHDDQSTITYNIPLSGQATDAMDLADPQFGLFKRNGSYLVNVKINGLTENEVVASIDIKDWETLKKQDVNIGDNH